METVECHAASEHGRQTVRAEIKWHPRGSATAACSRALKACSTLSNRGSMQMNIIAREEGRAFIHAGCVCAEPGAGLARCSFTARSAVGGGTSADDALSGSGGWPCEGSCVSDARKAA